jgi:hypothetical protein
MNTKGNECKGETKIIKCKVHVHVYVTSFIETHKFIQLGTAYPFGTLRSFQFFVGLVLLNL